MKTLHVLRKVIKNTIKTVSCKPMIFIPDILITYRCTQRCMQCSIPSKAFLTNSFMTFNDYKKIIDRLDKHGTQIVVISGGEPMLHPELPQFIKYAVNKNFARVHLLTTLYGPDRLVERTVQTAIDAGISLSISFDGFGAIGDTVRGVKYVSECVKKNIEYVKEEMEKRGKNIHCGVGVVISQLNIYQIKDILAYLENVGWITDIDIYRWQSPSMREDDQLKIKDTKELHKVLDIAKRSPIVFTPSWLLDLLPEYLDGRFKKYCPYLSLPTFGTKVFIDPDGSVRTCKGQAFGNILKQTVNELFSTDEWKKQLNDKKSCIGCVNTLYTRTKYLLPASIKEFRSYWEVLWNG